jgi:hypothetical protein
MPKKSSREICHLDNFNPLPLDETCSVLESREFGATYVFVQGVGLTQLGLCEPIKRGPNQRESGNFCWCLSIQKPSRSVLVESPISLRVVDRGEMASGLRRITCPNLQIHVGVGNSRRI